MVVYTLEQRWEILLHYFENHGNVAECVCENCVRILEEANFAAVAESVCEAPSTSIHCRSQQLNISETLLRRILHKDLGITQYKVQLVQELLPSDHPMRFRFAK